jgi:hypothetical protein
MGADKATGTQDDDAQRWRGIAIAVPKLAHFQLLIWVSSSITVTVNSERFLLLGTRWPYSRSGQG